MAQPRRHGRVAACSPRPGAAAAVLTAAGLQKFDYRGTAVDNCFSEAAQIRTER